MTNIQTYAASFIAAVGIAGAALMCAGPAMAAPDISGQQHGNHAATPAPQPVASPPFAQRHVDAALGAAALTPFPGHTHRHHGHQG